MDTTMLDYKILGAALKEARATSGYSQNDVAKVLGITYQNVSSWERGASKIDIDSLLILCEKYDLDFAAVLQSASKAKPATKNDDGLSADVIELAKKLGLMDSQDLELLNAQADVILSRRQKP